MKINFVRLQNFRNVEFAEVELGTDSVWICGANAQGKTNLLEALGLLFAARSFRTTDTTALVRKGEKEAGVLISVNLENVGDCEVEIKISKKREITIMGERINRLGDFIGRFPALPMTSEDVKLVRAAPETRRKDIDMFISYLDPVYFDALKNYHSALSQRNALLRAEEKDPIYYKPFETEMARNSAIIAQKRKERLRQMAEIAVALYSQLSGERQEQASISLKASSLADSAESFEEFLSNSRAKDIERHTTTKGVHRDDFPIFIGGLDAKTYASEGQQRSIALAIKLAQFRILKEEKGIEPVILCDDILSELDASRRAEFWKCIPPSAQVVSTSTELSAPACALRSDWKIVRVESGKYA